MTIYNLRYVYKSSVFVIMQVREGLERESKTLRSFNVQTSFHRDHIYVFYCSVLSPFSLPYIHLPGGRSAITTSIDDFPMGK
jgi:hypothetical protein